MDQFYTLVLYMNSLLTSYQVIFASATKWHLNLFGFQMSWDIQKM